MGPWLKCILFRKDIGVCYQILPVHGVLAPVHPIAVLLRAAHFCFHAWHDINLLIITGDILPLDWHRSDKKNHRTRSGGTFRHYICMLIVYSWLWLWDFVAKVGSHHVNLHASYDDVIKWKRFPRHWPIVRGIHQSPGDSPHKGQRRSALMFSLICAWRSVDQTLGTQVIWDAIALIMASL